MLPNSPLSLDAASYNIHRCIGTDRRFVPGRIAEVIRSLDADVLALQEVGWHLRSDPSLDQFDYLAEHTGYQVVAGLTRDHSRAQFGNAILTRLPVREVRRIDLSVSYRAPRGALDVDLDLDGQTVRVINVHLGLDPWERQVQFGRILESIEDRPDQPMIMLGDFNEWRLDFPPIKDLAPYLPNCLAPRSFHTRQPMFRYDRIYSSSELAVSSGKARRTQLTRRSSDHLPVFCRLSSDSSDQAQTLAA